MVTDDYRVSHEPKRRIDLMTAGKRRFWLQRMEEDEMAETATGNVVEPVVCECVGCKWCDGGCKEAAATVSHGEHLCRGCADIDESEDD